MFCGPSCVFTNVNNPRAEIERKDEFRPTLVKRGATIGANATIVCGHTVGEYAFIAAGAVVTAGRAGLRADGRRAGAAHRLDEPCRRAARPRPRLRPRAAGAIARPGPTASRRSSDVRRRPACRVRRRPPSRSSSSISAAQRRRIGAAHGRGDPAGGRSWPIHPRARRSANLERSSPSSAAPSMC